MTIDLNHYLKITDLSNLFSDLLEVYEKVGHTKAYPSTCIQMWFFLQISLTVSKSSTCPAVGVPDKKNSDLLIVNS